MAPAILVGAHTSPAATPAPHTSMEQPKDYENHDTLDHQDTESNTQGSDSELAHDATIIPYDNEYEKLNSTMQLAWGDVMDSSSEIFTSSTRYRDVHVLMLSWEDQYDDLKVQGELDELGAVFRDTYNFKVTHEQLTRREKKRTQTQINKIVADWVYLHDGTKTLLIVYFAGHGRRGSKDGDLEITGKRSLFDLQDPLDRVIWNRTEQILAGIEADVFQIFDCCYAGSFGSRGGSGSGASEYLAATTENGLAARPGPNSFTTALIWALKALAKDPSRFTTSQLAKKINTAPGFPESQTPILSYRPWHNPMERIVLQPLLKAKDSLEEASTNGTAQREITQQDVVTIKIIFETRPEAEQIKKIGEHLCNVVHVHKMHVNRIKWGGIEPDMVRRAVSHFQARRRGKSVAKSISKPASASSLKSGSSATKLAANLIKKVHEEVEINVAEQVHEQVHEEVQREFEAHSAGLRAAKRDS